jgi:hypothetical protein
MKRANDGNDENDGNDMNAEKGVDRWEDDDDNYGQRGRCYS